MNIKLALGAAVAALALVACSNQEPAAPAAAPAAPAPAADDRDKARKRKMVGIVTSDKMNKTRVVMVTRRISHKTYSKYVTQRVKYKAHDEKNQYKQGDKVEIIEAAPISRDKRWRIERLVQKAEEI